jgi:predicted patatin/cPLA2 family phospholipase
MRQRVEQHNNTIDLIRNPPQSIRIIEVCPPEDFNIGRFSRNIKRLQAGYLSGVEISDQVIADWSKFIQ